MVLRPLSALACLALALAGSLYGPVISPDSCSEALPLTPTPSLLSCAVACHRSAACLAFSHTGGLCRRYTGSPHGVPGVLSRARRAVPAGYTACRGAAYRVLPPQLRAQVLIECGRVSGGRMALPLSAEDRHFVGDLIATAGGQLQQEMDQRHVAYMEGVIEFVAGRYSYRSQRNGSLLNIPAEAFAPGQPDSEGYNNFLVMRKSGQYVDWNSWSTLMNACEVSLVEG